MTVLLLGLALACVAVAGVWVIAIAICARHADAAAAYPLFAVRDELIAAVVFGGVARDDEWLEGLYEEVNCILRYSHMISGPGDGWGRAALFGKLSVEEPRRFRAMGSALPKHRPVPEALQPVVKNLQGALTELTSQHLGFTIQANAERREHAKQRREAARRLSQELASPSLALV